MQALIKTIAAFTGTFLIAESADAFTPVNIPEPGILGLLAAGGIIAAVFAIRNRRK